MHRTQRIRVRASGNASASSWECWEAVARGVVKRWNYCHSIRVLIEQAESPMSLWIDWRLRFLDHVASGEQAAERAVLRYASWCTAEGAGSGPSDTLTAVLVAFYEDLASEKALWPRF